MNQRYKWSKKMDDEFRNGKSEEDSGFDLNPPPDQETSVPRAVRVLTALSMACTGVVVFLFFSFVIILLAKAVTWAMSL